MNGVDMEEDDVVEWEASTGPIRGFHVAGGKSTMTTRNQILKKN
jgi:hypothetical protein